MMCRRRLTGSSPPVILCPRCTFSTASSWPSRSWSPPLSTCGRAAARGSTCARWPTAWAACPRTCRRRQALPSGSTPSPWARCWRRECSSSRSRRDSPAIACSSPRRRSPETRWPGRPCGAPTPCSSRRSTSRGRWRGSSTGSHRPSSCSWRPRSGRTSSIRRGGAARASPWSTGASLHARSRATGGCGRSCATSWPRSTCS